jgi:hypothetical protein
MFIERPDVEFDNPLQYDFGIKNLIVSGCSFTFNNSNVDACTWPYYLKTLGGFDRVMDSSLPGAGNYHIDTSLRWNLMQKPVDPRDSLVIVMWSGNDRDDFIASIDQLNDYPFRHYYTKNSTTAISGGLDPTAIGNTVLSYKVVSGIKDQSSRSIENFLYITGLYAWLEQQGYKFVFLDYTDKTIPCRSLDFDIRLHLPLFAQKELNRILVKHNNLYNFAVKENFLDDDEYHPKADGHLAWTRKILIPLLQKIIT